MKNAEKSRQVKVASQITNVALLLDKVRNELKTIEIKPDEFDTQQKYEQAKTLLHWQKKGVDDIIVELHSFISDYVYENRED